MGPGYEYGRLEVFDAGFWTDVRRLSPDAAEEACRAFGYDGGAAPRFTETFAAFQNSRIPVCELLACRLSASIRRRCLQTKYMHMEPPVCTLLSKSQEYNVPSDRVSLACRC